LVVAFEVCGCDDGYMSLHLPSLRFPPIGFAHRGAKAHAPENTLEAFLLAVKLGATGLESDVWITADGEAVLDHDGVVGSYVSLRRRKNIADVKRADLPAHIPTLAELYEAVGTELELSLDIKDPAALPRVLECAYEASETAVRRLWLCHPDLELLEAWRNQDDQVRLVNSTRLDRLKEGPERRAATLAELGIDAMNMHQSDWSGGLVTLFHRFDRYALAWDTQFDYVIDRTLDMGVDAIYSDHVDLMMEGIKAYGESVNRPG